MRDKQAAPAASRRLWRSERYPLLRTTRVLGPPRYAVVIEMYDADGARRVMQHRLADGAERHSPDAAAAAGAHHEHLGAVRSRKQRWAGRAVDDLPVDGHLGMLLLAAGDRLIEIFYEQARAAQASGTIRQGAHGQQHSSPQRGF